MSETVHDYLSLLGYLLLRHGKTSRAIVILEALLALEPDNCWARRTLAYALLAAGDPRRSLRELDQVDPARAGRHDHLLRIRALWGLDRREEARDLIHALNGRLRGADA